MFIVIAFALAALACNVLQFVRRDRNYMGLIIGLTAATFLIGVSGTSAGIHMMSSALMEVEATQQLRLYFMGFGIANTTTEIGALLASFNAILAGIAHKRMTATR